jgi:hypothetical protein
MVTADEIRGVARRSFEDLKLRKHGDLASTKTPAEARAVEDNYERALATYLETLIEGFAQNGGAWDQLLADATAAEAELQQARADAAKLPERLKSMSKLTTSVARLVEAAK